MTVHSRYALISIVCLALGSTLVGCDKDKDEKKPHAGEELKKLGDGALTYFQEEHAADDMGLAVITRVYPVAETPVCSADGGEVWEQLRYKPGDLDVCYQSTADGKAFAAWIEGEGCIWGQADEIGSPELSAIEDDLDACKAKLK